jgi:two-component system sensor histidine kinase HydH
MRWVVDFSAYLCSAVLLAGFTAGVVFFVHRRWGRALHPRAATNTHDQDQRRVAELSQLAGGLAHEIKNPLSTINVNLELLAEDLRHSPASTPDHQRWLRRLDTVRAETDRLKTTLDDFLHFARQEELTLQQVNLCDVVSQLIDFFSPQTQAHHVVLRHALPEHPVICNIDVKLVKQAILNLMINANDAMAEGGELLLQVTADDTNALIEVIDTGVGIAPDDMNRIFDVYYSSKAGGSGLGLPTTRKIVERHGGTLSVDSEPGRGTRFALTFPLS